MATDGGLAANIVERMRGAIDRPILWAAPDAPFFVWREWDGLTMVYSQTSGGTHLLDPLAREIFDLVAEQPRQIDEILREIQSVVDKDLDDAFRHRIVASVSELDNIGLIVPTETAASGL